MFLKHLATPIELFRDPPGGRDPQLEEPWFRAGVRNLLGERAIKAAYF